MALLDTIKKAGAGAIEAGKPVTVHYGTVRTVNPLEVVVDQRLPLPEDFLIVPEQLKMYKLKIGEQEYWIREGLREGDKVLLLRVQGGQRYVVWDKVTDE